MSETTQKHFGAFFDENARVLILGSFPSQASLNAGFFYQNTSNRFWTLFEELFNVKGLKGDINAQKSFLKSHHIALWDIFTVCTKDSNGSADESIIESKSTKSDLSEILKKAKIEGIFTTIGKENSPCFKKWGIKEWISQYKSYFPHCKSVDEILRPLFSSSQRSPKTLQDLLDDYSCIKKILQK